MKGEEAIAGWLDAETKVAQAPADHRLELRSWLRLLTCATLIESEVRRRLREQFDTTLPRFDLLAQLEKAEDGLVLGEVSKRMMVSAGNVTAVVERLLEAGLITRSPSPHDRRVQVICLTSKGRREFKVMADAHAEWISALFGGMAPAKMEQLLGLLGTLKGSVLEEVGPR